MACAQGHEGGGIGRTRNCLIHFAEHHFNSRGNGMDVEMGRTVTNDPKTMHLPSRKKYGVAGASYVNARCIGDFHLSLNDMKGLIFPLVDMGRNKATGIRAHFNEAKLSVGFGSGEKQSVGVAQDIDAFLGRCGKNRDGRCEENPTPIRASSPKGPSGRGDGFRLEGRFGFGPHR